MSRIVAKAVSSETLLPLAAGTTLALTFVFELGNALPAPFAWHFLLAAGLFVLAASLHYSFLCELSRSTRTSLGGVLGGLLDGGLAMVVWGMGALALVRAICALLPLPLVS